MKKYDDTQAALAADRARRTLAPTFDGVRGGAVPVHSDPARDSARARIPMV
ncbi:hypothetical protein [uncultured Cellulomonas sp.]|uniref:hypothetical protein n=1 Tax=uncultured Cellulomonas sp. TaxID=189682 RepID=UPI0026226212|nr:hypothetical protein [uncultured Cellulomonas sp.]